MHNNNNPTLAEMFANQTDCNEELEIVNPKKEWKKAWQELQDYANKIKKEKSEINWNKDWDYNL